MGVSNLSFRQHTAKIYSRFENNNKQWKTAVYSQHSQILFRGPNSKGTIKLCYNFNMSFIFWNHVGFASCELRFTEIHYWHTYRFRWGYEFRTYMYRLQQQTNYVRNNKATTRNIIIITYRMTVRFVITVRGIKVHSDLRCSRVNSHLQFFRRQLLHELFFAL